MSRGRQKGVSAGRRHKPSTSSRRSRDRTVSHDAVYVTAVTREEAESDVNNPVHDRLETSGSPTHPRWDVASPANWSASLLRQTIEDRGIQMPSGIKISQLLRIYLDNFDTPYQPDVISSATTWHITSLLLPVRCRHLLHRQLMQLPLLLHRGHPLAGVLQPIATDLLPWRVNDILRIQRLLQHRVGTCGHQPNVSYPTLAPRWSHSLMSYAHYNRLCRRLLRDWTTWTNDRSPRDNKSTHRHTTCNAQPTRTSCHERTRSRHRPLIHTHVCTTKILHVALFP